MTNEEIVEQLVTGFVPASVGTSFTIETDKANNTNGYTGFIMFYNSSKQPIGGLPNATDYRIVLFGGNWSGGANAGDYCVFCNNAARAGNGFIGGRLLFVPTATV